MKKIILIVSLFIGIITGYSQVNGDCITAIPLCSNPSFSFNSLPPPNYGNTNELNGPSISNPFTNPASSNSGCLMTNENNPQWLIITVGNAGSLEFVFGAATSPNPQAGFYDWAMWPYSPTACSQILNNTLPPVRCNWNGPGSGGTGIASASNIPAGGSPQNYEPPLLVNACQQFVICISNYSNINTLVSFQTLGTASLSCNPNCNPNYMICAGSNATITPVNFASLSNPTYSLNPGALTNTTGNFVVTPLVTTTYTTYITGMNSSNVVQTTTALSTVTVNPQPSASPTATQSSCTNTTNAFNLGLTFTPSSPVPNYTITWSPIPFSVSNPTQTSGSGGIAPGQYNATITAAGGCSVITGFSINPSPSPVSFNLVPGGGNYTVTCAQPTVVINANPASYNYTWTNGVSTPQTGSSGNFTSLTLGNWSVTAVNPASGCSATQTFVVSQNVTAPTSTVTPLTQNITCNIASIITVTGTGTPSTNVTHQWIAPSGATVTSNLGVSPFLPGGPGTYTHCLINNINGCSSCSTFTVSSTAGFPTFSVVSPQQFTLGCGTTSLISINIVGAQTTPTPGGPLSYTILPPTYAGPSYTVGTAFSYTANIPGSYTVIVHDNTNSCETTAQVSVITNTAVPSLTATAVNPTLTCYNPKTILQGISNTPNVSYSWMFPGIPGQVPNDTLTVYSTTAVATVSVATYTLAVTNNISTCKSTQTLTIYQDMHPPIPGIIPPGNLSITCATSSVVLTNSSNTWTYTPNIYPHFLPVVAELWEGPSPEQPTQFNSSYIASTPGTYTLHIKDLNNGCTTFTTKTIADNRIYPIVNTPNPPPPFIMDCASPGATIYPIMSGTTTGFTYSWVSVPTASFSSQITETTIVNEPGIYKIIVTNPSNGCISYGVVEVMNGGITGDFSPSTQTGYAPLTVSFQNLSSSSSTATGSSSITSVWSFGNGASQITTSANISPTTVYANAGTYTVTLYVSKGTCRDTVSKVIRVDIPSKLDVPNVFTPNGDGSNDTFFLKVANISEITALIFDRWGNKVYESTSTTGNIEWDGKNMAGKDASVGTYFYIIKGTGKDGTAYDKKGNVSIYR